MKKYRDFAFPRVAVGLLIGLLLFGFTTMVFEYRYDATLQSGNTAYFDKYQRMIDMYDDGELTPEFIGMMANFYQMDYLRISKIDDSGKIEPIFETDYSIVPVSASIHEWYYVTRDDALAGTELDCKQPNPSEFELNIKYLKCDEIWEPAESLDTYMTNSYNLLAFSEGWYVSELDPFFLVSEIYGNNCFPCLDILSYYTEGDTLHLGLVRRGISQLPFAKKWDFTAAADKDKYLQATRDDPFIGSICYGVPVRPDEFLAVEDDVFMQDQLSYIYASGKMEEGERYYSTTLTVDGRKTFGTLRIYETGGHRYLYEGIITAQSFAEYYTPFMIVYGIFLALVFIGIPMLAALRPYRQYKKAYENNLFKNNLIDSLAHNLKTPLQILGGYAENLKDVDGASEKDRYADRILEKAAEMNAGIEAILKTAEKSNPVLVKTSMREIVDQVAQAVGADCEIEGDAVLAVDKEYFAQALTCLIDNASKYKTVRPVVVKISPAAIVITNKTDKDTFTPGTGIAIAGRILEQHKLKLTTAIKGGVFEAKITKK